ncbi:MAG: HI0074 family nucleotidyltransferase substrate-binding subunit [Fimbriimonadaceae bacterium]|nr:HI0074 family nucleotidyltransferase substrate-binding subunit [Fimbriimonadaceae bacterium]
MNPRDLDLTPLSHAVDRLQEGRDVCRAHPENLLFRDGLIQRFKYTYELAHRTLRRYLATVSDLPGPAADWTLATVIREASRLGLIRSGWPEWRNYREMRSRSNHTYDESIAVQVADGIPDFLTEALELRHRLQAAQRAAAEEANP